MTDNAERATPATSVELRTVDDVPIEARWDRPSGWTTSAVVFCHPHPLHRGTMHAPLMNGITDGLVDRGFAVLRFNFRGVGGSGGAHQNGIGELLDVAAAIDEAAKRYAEIGLAGWSFGGALALRWLARSASTDIRYVGIAPAPRFLPPAAELPLSPKRIIVGSRDKVIDREALISYGRDVGADVVEIGGSDHFFHFRHELLAGLAAEFLARQS